MLESLLNGSLARAVRSHRRVTASVLIAVAAFMAFTSIPTRVIEPVRPSTPAPAVDEVIVPITLGDAQAAQALQVGDSISLIVTTDDGYAETVTDSARVRSVSSSTGLGHASAGSLTVLVPRSAALRLAAAPVRGVLSVIIHPTVDPTHESR